MDAHLGRTRRTLISTLLCAAVLSTVVPLVARGDAACDAHVTCPTGANTTCASSAKMTEGPGMSISNPSVGMYPPFGAEHAAVSPHKSNWFTGVFHDIILEADAPLSLYLYDYRQGTGCAEPREVVCQADASGPSSPGRCQFSRDSQRYYVEVRNDGETDVPYNLISGYHCYLKNTNGSCVIVTPEEAPSPPALPS